MRSENIVTKKIASGEKSTHLKRENKFQEEQVYTALCTNCDERLYCKIRNNTSVIWHCEEYK